MPGRAAARCRSSACGSRSRTSWRAVSSRSASSGCSSPLQLTLPPSETSSSRFALAVGAAAVDDEEVGRRRAAAGQQRRERGATRERRPPHTTTSRASPASRRKRGVESTPSSRSPSSRRRSSRPPRRTPRCGSPAARRRCRAARRASARTSRGPGSQSAGICVRPQRARRAAARRAAASSAPNVARPSARLALRGGRDEQREPGVEAVERPEARMTAIMLSGDRMDTTPLRRPRPRLPAARRKARRALAAVPPGARSSCSPTDPEAPIDVAAVAADAGCAFAAGGRRRLAVDAARPPAPPRGLSRRATTCAARERRRRRRAVAGERRRCACPPRAPAATPGAGVLDHRAARRLDAEPPAAARNMSGAGLPCSISSPATVDRERVGQPGAGERAVQPRARRGGRDRDGEAARARRSRTVSSASANGSSSVSISANSVAGVAVPERVARLQPGDPLGEERVHARVRQADQPGVLRLVDRVAVGRQRPLPRGARERLRVDQRPVAVEDRTRLASVTCGRGTRSRRRAPAPASAR